MGGCLRKGQPGSEARDLGSREERRLNVLLVKDVVAMNEQALTRLFRRVCSDHFDLVSRALADLACSQGLAQQLIDFAVMYECNSVLSNPALFLRSPTLSSGILSRIFENLGGYKIVTLIFADVLTDLFLSCPNFEVNPDKENFEEKNLDQLLAVTDACVERILSLGSLESGLKVPFVVHMILGSIRRLSLEMFPERDWMLSVSSFLFLRVLCPSIASPGTANELKSLLPKSNSEFSALERRNFILLSKFIHSTGSGKSHGEKEASTERVSSWIAERYSRIKALVSMLSDSGTDTSFFVEPNKFVLLPDDKIKCLQALETYAS